VRRGGILLNAVALPPDPRWEIAPNADSWGTSETIAAIQVAIDTVHELFRTRRRCSSATSAARTAEG
jgi:hypothetical protein